jgi:glycopeptide antibiotics resistance protein
VPFSGQIRSFALMIILGLFQAVWALRLSGKDVIRWTLATTVGCFALALPFRFLLNGFPPNRLSLANEMVFLALLGAGIGLLQFLVFPKNAFKAWRWIPATLSGVLGGHFTSVGLVYTSTSWFRYGLVLFIGGAVLGVFTCFSLESILRRRGDTEGAIES